MAFVTGGASELAREVAKGEAEKRRQEEAKVVQAQLERLKQLAGGGVPADREKTAPCGGVEVPPPPAMRVPSGDEPGGACCRYQLNPPFLLDAHGGRVWRYDQQKDAFVMVRREATKVEESWETLLKAKLTADLHDQVKEATRGATLAEFQRVGPRMEAHLALLDEELRSRTP
jgi:hypothetical protein